MARLAFTGAYTDGLDGTRLPDVDVASTGSHLARCGRDHRRRRLWSEDRRCPVLWEDMENGEFDSRWTETPARVVTEARHGNSTFAGNHNFQASGGDGNRGYFAGPNNKLGRRWFVQYWFKLDSNFDWGYGTSGNPGGNLSNVKIFRMWNPGSVDENFVTATRGYANTDELSYSVEYVADDGQGYYGNRGEWTKGQWHCFQFEYEDSDVGQSNGVFRMWFNGQLYTESTTLLTREDFAELKRPFIVGFYDSWSDSSTDRDDYFIDDVYIDRSWARVEIGNAASYGACTQREIQIPRSWGNGSIDVDLNLGSFSSSAPLYLFVTDENGNVSSGFPIDR